MPGTEGTDGTYIFYNFTGHNSTHESSSKSRFEELHLCQYSRGGPGKSHFSGRMPSVNFTGFKTSYSKTHFSLGMNVK